MPLILLSNIAPHNVKTAVVLKQRMKDTRIYKVIIYNTQAIQRVPEIRQVAKWIISV